MDQDRIFNKIAREMGILVEFSLTERKCVHSQYWHKNAHCRIKINNRMRPYLFPSLASRNK